MTKIQTKIKSFADLSEDWDSYGSKGINQYIIDSAFKITEKIRELNGQPLWAEPTTDETILMAFKIGQTNFKIEIEEQIGIAEWKNFDEPKFWDCEVGKFCCYLDSLENSSL